MTENEHVLNASESHIQKRRAKSFLRRHRVHDLALLFAVLGASHTTVMFITAGTVVFLMGYLLTIWSKLVLIRKKELATCGPYAICRHPFYTGNALLDLGLILISGNIWILLFYPFLFWMGYLDGL